MHKTDFLEANFNLPVALIKWSDSTDQRKDVLQTRLELDSLKVITYK
jgi:hypothetical protein